MSNVLQDIFSDYYAYDETHHWHEATCDCNVEVKDIAEHTWNSGVIEGDTTIFTCIVCQETKEEIIRNEEPVIPEDTEDTISEGLEYELNDDGQSYSVVGIGECIDPDVKIPEIYNNLPVTSIGTL